MGGCPAEYVIPVKRVPTNEVGVAPEFALMKLVPVRSMLDAAAPSSVFPESDTLGPRMKFDCVRFVMNLYPAGRLVDASYATLSEMLPEISAPLKSALLKFVFTNSAPRKLALAKSTSGPIMYPPDAVVATYR